MSIHSDAGLPTAGNTFLDRYIDSESKNYAVVLQGKGKEVTAQSLYAAQVNLWRQDLRHHNEGHRNGSNNNGFLIVGTGATNDFTITGGDGTENGAGRFFVNGFAITLLSNTTYNNQASVSGAAAPAALTTPGVNRTDEVYLELYFDEIDGTEDATLIDPSFGFETERRIKGIWAVKVAEGGTTPANFTDGNGRLHYTEKIATLARTASTATISAGMVTDNRKKLKWEDGNISNAITTAGLAVNYSDLTLLYNAIATIAVGSVRPSLNVLRNGACDYWPIGNTFSGISSSNGLARQGGGWELKVLSGSTAVYTLSKDTDVPTSAISRSSLKVACTTIDASVAAGDLTTLITRVEGYMYAPLFQKPTFLAFWVKSNLTGSFGIALSNFSDDRRLVTTFTINAANTWERKIISITAISSGGVWNLENGRGIEIRIGLVVGSSLLTATANSWISSPAALFTGITGSQVNFASSTSNYINITEVQFGSGLIVPPFEPAPRNAVTELCGRYLQYSYEYGTNLGTATIVGCVQVEEQEIHPGAHLTSLETFTPKMRIAPTVTLYSTNSGASGNVYAPDIPQDIAVSSFSGASSRNLGNVVLASSMTTVTPDRILFHYFADADMT